MKKTLSYQIIIFAVVLTLIIGVVVYFSYQKNSNKKIMIINNYKVTVEISKTPEQLARGLSGRKFLAENQGMLFIFPYEDFRAFWMPDMNFPLDIIWINKNCEVVSITKNIPVCKEQKNCPMVTPNQLSQYVLEVVAGFAEKHQVYIGQKLGIC